MKLKKETTSFLLAFITGIIVLTTSGTAVNLTISPTTKPSSSVSTGYQSNSDGSTVNFSSTAPSPDCFSNQTQLKMIGKTWLSNSTTRCFCKSNLMVECVTLDDPACMDISGTIRNNSEEWFNSSCVKCTCVNGSISCYKADVTITYGLFKVDFTTCERCNTPSQTQARTSACEAFFRIPKQRLFQCAVRGFYIQDVHRCNGISECPDGLDETGCEDAICRDEGGSTFIIKNNGWQESPCVRCHCMGGNMFCQRSLEVFFPAYWYGSHKVDESCAQPSCNVLRFLENKGHICEAIEIIENAGLLMKGQTYNNNGCDMFFPGPNDDEDVVCPEMAREACYVFDGGVCCTSECSALNQLGTQIRGDITYCPSGRQLAARKSQCGKSVIPCTRDHGNQNCSSVVSCKDEDFNKYFEGATWTVGSCIQCLCQGGKINCTRKITIITSEKETRTESCNQVACNVVKYLKIHGGVCKACRWKDQVHFDGSHWKENGVDFYCSSSENKVRPGCYVERNRVKCTGAIPGLRDLSKISNESLFLCESGDEMRSPNDRCNVQPDCDDQSDERNCLHYYCGSVTGFGVLWDRTRVHEDVFKNCSLIDSTWQGTFSRKCYADKRRTINRWSDSLTSCRCEKRSIINYFKLRLAQANKTNILATSKELSSSAGNFTNGRIFLEMFTNLFDNAVNILTKTSNSDLVLLYFEHVIETVFTNWPAFHVEKRFCRTNKKLEVQQINALIERAEEKM